MLKSKDIVDFVETELKDLHPDVPVPVDLHLFFRSNNHVLIWKPQGTTFSKEVLGKLVERGIRSVWIHKTEWQSFHQYLKPRPAPETRPEVDVRETSPSTLEWVDTKRKVNLSTELIYKSAVTHKTILDILDDGGMDDRKKKGKIAIATRSLLGELASQKDLESQREVSQSISNEMYELLNKIQGDANDFMSEIWKITQLNPEFAHSVNVATLSVLFAMAFGRIEQEQLLTLATASLLHDIGITQVPYQITQKPWETHTIDEKVDFHQHTSGATEFLATFAPHISKRVVAMIKHHHDDFSDAPITNSAVDLAQFIALADTIDSLCNGSVDGTVRTFYEALSAYEARELPNFNKETYGVILRWIRENIAKEETAA